MMDLGRWLTIAVISIIVGIVSITVLGFLVIGPDDVNGQEIMMCFATKQLADDFLKQFPEHTNHNIVIGCPVLNLNNTVEDESGK